MDFYLPQLRLYSGFSRGIPCHCLICEYRFVYLLMGLLFVVAWPLSKLLDCLLGKDHNTFYRRAQLKVLVDLHGPVESAVVSDDATQSDPDHLTVDEVLIIKVRETEGITSVNSCDCRSSFKSMHLYHKIWLFCISVGSILYYNNFIKYVTAVFERYLRLDSVDIFGVCGNSQLQISIFTLKRIF